MIEAKSFKPKAILLMGPTATNKTKMAIELASLFPIEIISVDSALIYQDMNIGTAKPTTEEMRLVKHHLIDIILPTEIYSVMNFIQTSVQLIQEINSRGKIALLVGGSMMYFNALINGLSVLPASDIKLRFELESSLARHGWDYMYQQLLDIDMTSAAKIAANDKHRLIRALEVYKLSGSSLSELQARDKLKFIQDIDSLVLGILPQERSYLHAQINQRFQTMIDNGFIDEVRNLRLNYPMLTIHSNSMRSVGYAQVWNYLDNKLTIDELVNLGSIATRQLAKRQMTWLRSLKFCNLANESFNYELLFKNLHYQVKSWLRLD